MRIHEELAKSVFKMLTLWYFLFYENQDIKTKILLLMKIGFFSRVDTTEHEKGERNLILNVNIKKAPCVKVLLDIVSLEKYLPEKKLPKEKNYLLGRCYVQVSPA